jgi:hypothetical protein
VLGGGLVGGLGGDAVAARLAFGVGPPLHLRSKHGSSAAEAVLPLAECDTDAYHPHQRILLVGEGNFTFAAALAAHLASQLGPLSSGLAAKAGGPRNRFRASGGGSGGGGGRLKLIATGYDDETAAAQLPDAALALTTLHRLGVPTMHAVDAADAEALAQAVGLCGNDSTGGSTGGTGGAGGAGRVDSEACGGGGSGGGPLEDPLDGAREKGAFDVIRWNNPHAGSFPTGGHNTTANRCLLERFLVAAAPLLASASEGGGSEGGGEIHVISSQHSNKVRMGSCLGPVPRSRGLLSKQGLVALLFSPLLLLFL